MQNNNYIKEDFKWREVIIRDILLKILSTIYANQLVFKWGTSLSLFYNLWRFSEDLDFSIIDTDKIKDVVNDIYNYIKNTEYEVSEIHRDWTNIVHFDVFYYIWDNKYTCQLEFFKSNYNIPVLYNNELFLWKQIQIMTLEQNFAHKCCAYLERWNRKIERSWKPKWRDLYDMLFYIKNHISVDMNIIKARTNLKTEKELFLKILIQLWLKHKRFYNDFETEIENFSYTWENWKLIIQNLLTLIKESYFWKELTCNLNYLEDLQDFWTSRLSKNCNITFQNDRYEILYYHKDKEWNISSKPIYFSKDINKINTVIEKNFWILCWIEKGKEIIIE